MRRLLRRSPPKCSGQCSAPTLREVTVRIERAAGDRSAAPSPSTARAITSQPLDVANPQNREAAVKMITPVTNTRRRPSLSATLPPSMRNPPKNRA